MKKRLLIVVTIFMLVAIVIILILYNNRNYINTDIDEEYKTLIAEEFKVDLPEKGEVQEYKFSIFDSFIEVRLNEREYEQIVEQLESAGQAIEYSKDLSTYCDMEDGDIVNEFLIVSTHTSAPAYFKPIYNVYLSKVEDDVFRIIFEIDEIP